jgi:hypothetical protein
MRRRRGKGNTHDQRRAGQSDDRLFSLERLADEEVPGVEYSVGGGEVKLARTIQDSFFRVKNKQN